MIYTSTQICKCIAKDIIETFNRYKLNNQFDLCTFGKDLDLVQKKVNLNRHFEKFAELEYILLQKDYDKNRKSIMSPAFLNESIKTFSKLVSDL